jgi:hypothetical protein
MFNLAELEEVTGQKRFIPSSLDTIYYCFWDKGISLKEFNELPIPYLVNIMFTWEYAKRKEAEALKKK